jgi:DNA-binding NarL/FixJ family response regulator
VLVADDHRLVAEALTALLAPEFELLGIVGDGSALVEAARIHQPDVIVSDIAMPGMNGLDALRALRGVAPAARVVILTMHTSPAYARQALQSGATGYLLKHAAGAELVMAVRAVARGESYVSAEVLRRLADSGGADGQQPQGKRITARQQEILALLVDGLSAKEIARRLDISPRTVEFHKYAMMETLGISRTAELVRFALAASAIDVDPPD